MLLRHRRSESLGLILDRGLKNQPLNHPGLIPCQENPKRHLNPNPVDHLPLLALDQDRDLYQERRILPLNLEPDLLLGQGRNLLQRSRALSSKSLLIFGAK